MLLIIMIAVSVLSAAAVALTGKYIGALLTLVGSFLGQLILAFLFFVVVCALVDRKKPQEKDSPFHRVMLGVYIQSVLPLLRLKIHTQGLEKIPAEGPLLLVCNHLSNLDPVILMRYFYKKKIVFVSKRENQTMPFVGSLMHKLRCPLINRENDREALKSIIRCIQLVREDDAVIGLFPEGYVSLDGRLRQFRSGAFKIAQKTGIPIVVCTIRDTAESLSRLVKLRSSEVTVHLVDVISTERLEGLSTQEISQLVYETMISDLGEERRCEEKGMHPDLQRKQMEQQSQN